MTARRQAAWRMGAAGPALAAMDAGDSAPWQDFAACAETDPDVFFPDKGESPRPARMVCAQCFVRQECLGYAMGDPSLLGVWGGLTAAERWALRRRKAA